MRNNKPRFLISVLVCTLILGLCSSVFAANEAAGKKEKQKIIASQIYFNGTVVTVDENMSYAQAVAVKDGKIIAVGKLGDIMPLSGKDTEKINLKGKALLPGFYDAHGHFLMAGESYLTKVQLQSPPIGTIENMEQLLAALSERAETLILGNGY